MGAVVTGAPRHRAMQSEIRRLHEFAAAGVSQTQAAKRLGRSRGFVTYWAERSDKLGSLRRRHAKHRPNPLAAAAAQRQLMALLAQLRRPLP